MNVKEGGDGVGSKGADDFAAALMGECSGAAVQSLP